MRLLDLYCCAGGAATGYHRAGFDQIVGVDISPQPRYPFTFIQADAVQFLIDHGHDFDVIHASPPCQCYSRTRRIRQGHGEDQTAKYHSPISQLRELLRGRPYVIENVVGAPLNQPVRLCGTMFGLRVLRHRLFESSLRITAPHHDPHPRGNLTKSHNSYSKDTPFITVAGHNFHFGQGCEAMGIDWMKKHELAEAIPPVYTDYIGKQVLEQLRVP